MKEYKFMKDLGDMDRAQEILEQINNLTKQEQEEEQEISAEEVSPEESLTPTSHSQSANQVPPFVDMTEELSSTEDAPFETANI